MWRGTRWYSLLRHCDTSRKVAGSIPDGIFYWLNLSRVDSTSNKNEYQGYLVRGKDGRCVGLTNLPPSCSDYLESVGASTSWNPNVIAFDMWQRVVWCQFSHVLERVLDQSSLLTFRRRASYIYRTTAPLTSRCWILYIYSTNINTKFFKTRCNVSFFSLQNAVYNFFGSCVIHILHTGCAKS
jgi:hypothetical protein